MLKDKKLHSQKLVSILIGAPGESGMLFTWGDPYYVGLNGLEFYDAQGQKLHSQKQVSIHSINSLVTVLCC